MPIRLPAVIESTRSTWPKILDRKAKWKNTDEFLDVIYWLRQIVSILCGLVCGLVPLKGVIGLTLFLLTNLGAVYTYSSQFHNIDPVDYGGLNEILKEGLMTAFATFLIVWIVLYTYMTTQSGQNLYNSSIDKDF